jgi:hypothetical protein
MTSSSPAVFRAVTKVERSSVLSAVVTMSYLETVPHASSCASIFVETKEKSNSHKNRKIRGLGVTFTQNTSFI